MHQSNKALMKPNRELEIMNSHELKKLGETALEAKRAGLDSIANDFEIKTSETFEDCAEIVDIYGQGCNYPTGKGVSGFQVDYVVVVHNIEYAISIQSEDRSDGMRAYCGIEMDLGSGYGCDDDFDKLSDVLTENDEYILLEAIQIELISDAEDQCKLYYQANNQ